MPPRFPARFTELLFESLDNVWMDFEDRINPLDHLTWVVPPEMMPRVQAVFEEIEADPKLKARLTAILAAKKDEYREGEAARRLVG